MKESIKTKFENIVNEEELTIFQFISCFAEKVMDMPPFEMNRFRTLLESTEIKIKKGEWEKSLYYAIVLLGDVFKDSENLKKSESRNQILDYIKMSSENLKQK